MVKSRATGGSSHDRVAGSTRSCGSPTSRAEAVADAIASLRVDGLELDEFGAALMQRDRRRRDRRGRGHRRAPRPSTGSERRPLPGSAHRSLPQPSRPHRPGRAGGGRERTCRLPRVDQLSADACPAPTTSSTCASSTGRSSRTSTRGPGNCAPCSSSRPGRRSACRTRSSPPPRTSSAASPRPTTSAAATATASSTASPLLAEVNALHPFREGNGRTQRAVPVPARPRRRLPAALGARRPRREHRRRTGGGRRRPRADAGAARPGRRARPAQAAAVAGGAQCRSCGGGGGSWPGGGGGGIDSRPGASPGQTSSTGHGAWSTTNRVAGPRLCGPSRLRSPSRAQISRIALLGRRHHLALDPAGALLGRRRAAQPLRRRGPTGRRRPRRTARRCSPPGRACPGPASPPAHRARRPISLPQTCSSTMSSSGGTQVARRVDARRPRPLGHPHDRRPTHV